ncbi:MAG: hypothetical protein K8S16_19750 [Bacteroidales bacterium]|nr:hypothetical protein [Bacteroidales bacterium]
MESPNNLPTDNKGKRPDILTVLCILTFIGSGLAVFSNLFIYLSFDEVAEILDDVEFDLPEFKMILSGGKSFFMAGFFLYMVSLAGAIQMWKFRKIGFHLYTAAQIFILVLPVVTIDSYQFSIASLFITLAFVFGYFSQLKIMK